MTCIATAPVSRRRTAAPPRHRAAAASSSGVASRPVLFSKAGADLTVACTHDYMGRRATKVVTENGQITSSHRFLYRGYLQVACCDRTRANHPCLWLITWDPTQPIATRPLAIQKDGTWYTYGWDLTKNICEVYGQHGYIRTNYFYSPYGGVTTNGDVTQPIQWSAEFCDVELGLVYYNFRYYNCSSGRWIQRDGVHKMDNYNLYVYAHNSVPGTADYQGLWTQKGVLKIICCSKYKYNIDDFNLRGLVVISFSKATDVWKYDSGKIVHEDITARLHGNSSKNKIRINVNLNDTQAATTLFHEIQHTDPKLDSLGYLEEEVAVRIRTEQFAIDKKLPPTGKNYRKKQEKNMFQMK